MTSERYIVVCDPASMTDYGFIGYVCIAEDGTAMLWNWDWLEPAGAAPLTEEPR